jgi:hypothetical protein
MENQKNKLTASITRYQVTMEDITSFVKESIVKFIFLDKEYADISSDENVNEIHKFKSVYRGNTYIRVPLKIVKEENDKYASGIIIDKTLENPVGYAVISKHDIRDMSKEMKKAKKEERIAFGEKIIEEYVAKLNKFLKNDILIVKIKDINNNVLQSKLISGGLDVSTINKEVFSIIDEINKIL